MALRSSLFTQRTAASGLSNWAGVAADTIIRRYAGPARDCRHGSYRFDAERSDTFGFPCIIKKIEMEFRPLISRSDPDSMSIPALDQESYAFCTDDRSGDGWR
ncbi:hypothetical protein NL676_020667 [Syzygium grande]|nr:hypothetical protein NL676_020667 [Syzygium grande]